MGLVGMIVLVSLIEAGLSRHPLRFADTASFNWRLAADDVAREASTVEVACFGDSLTKIGIVPEVIRARTGLKTYNFAMARAPAQASYFLLRRLLESGGKPKAILVDFKSSIQAGRPRLGIRHFEEIVNLREAVEFLVEDGNQETLFAVPPGPGLRLGSLAAGNPRGGHFHVTGTRCPHNFDQPARLAELDGQPGATF